MEPWQIGLIVFAVVGAAALFLAYRRDKVTAARAKEALHNPPDREIPRFDPATPAPHYLSEDESRRPPPGAASTDLTVDERTSLRTRLDGDTTTRITGGYAQRVFATDSPTTWAVLDEPLVLVASDTVSTMRELLPALALLDGHPLVITAPGYAGDVLDTLRANRTQRTLRVCPVTTDHDPSDLAALVHGRPTSAADRQAGYMPRESLGRPQRWVSDSASSWIIL